MTTMFLITLLIAVYLLAALVAWYLLDMLQFVPGISTPSRTAITAAALLWPVSILAILIGDSLYHIKGKP